MSAIQPLANDYVTLYESPDPARLFCYSPGLARCPTGRLVATLDLGGPGVADLSGPKGAGGDTGPQQQGKAYTSDDGGRTWAHRLDFPFMHARPFVAGDALYILGQMGDLMVVRSDDWGESWSEPARLTEGQRWHQAPCNVHQANGCVYLVMERQVYDDVRGWPVSAFAPVLLRGPLGADLTQRASWTLASELAFRDAVPAESLDYFGVPWYETPPRSFVYVAPGRGASAIGWLESNVVQFVNPDHVWCDPTGHTFHLWMRAHTSGTNLAAIVKVVEREDGRMETMLETAPSGRKMVYVPCPGGQMRFHILYDEPTRLYWLLSSQATDSMCRPERLPEERYNLPNNERHRLQLHFSRNCVDWCFAGLVAVGGSPRQSRHYASMVIDGDDLRILSRSGDARAKDAHNGNLITFHTVRDFRGLVY
ncbi:MAG: exo-alpha-sialidase [Chloroflexi bacterium]|nr:exo-alpha-sialidase [Chloroflexota bacterium]